MDTEWLKNLAKAKPQNGRLLPENPERVQESARRAIGDAIMDIRDELKDCLEIFNMHTEGHQLNMLPLRAQNGGPLLHGFVLLLGSYQLRLEQKEMQLTATLTSFEGFQKTDRLLHNFQAKVDNFGGITWLMDQQFFLTSEWVVKLLLRELCEAAYVKPSR